MKKPASTFLCQTCGYASPKWLGRCPDCNSWNTLVEESLESPGKGWSWISPSAAEATPITAIRHEEAPRQPTRLGELDRVLGGGVVPGSLVLIGGDPGIGKSTLLLQALDRVALGDRRVLYVSGEESPAQIKLRGERLGVASQALLILSEISLEAILKTALDLRPAVMAIDSIQTVHTEELSSAPGSVGQLRECAGRLMTFAKRSGIPIFLIGHVTKDGAIAGPRVLEHMVDTVLYFEGEKGHSYRILRAVKNRFGSTHEIGVFDMRSEGLVEVSNPSAFFLAEKHDPVSGSVVVGSTEGTRPLLVEVQALVGSSALAMPRRMAVGVDPNRLSLLLAVLDKVVGVHLHGNDVFVNVVGGLRLEEPGIDLGVVAAVVSSFREKPVDVKTVFCGEVGLGGEVRTVRRSDAMIREAAALGFSRAIVPAGDDSLSGVVGGLEIVAVRSVSDLLDVVFR